MLFETVLHLIVKLSPCLLMKAAHSFSLLLLLSKLCLLMVSN